MRSGELAELAGVTVRTIRHYHQIGILEEPPRSLNGYREYGVGHLVRVLRIKRLADLGFALQDLPLDDDADHDSRLASLDAELAAQIDRLTRQRAVIAALRAGGASPDLPPELATHAALAVGLPPRMAKLEREQVLLLAHLGGEEASRLLEDLHERLAEPAVTAAFGSIYERFDLIDESTPAVELDRLVTESTEALVAALGDLDLTTPLDLGSAEGLIDEHGATQLNATQLKVLNEIAEQLSQRLA
ncbi:MerR family transcriptional regulator [Aeromicrobium senzhongii]|uniref:MerR family transcriptional regulator n=1 Tax=Aeromicrobium senzhongii TaxID=2663859 RepID=A0ABX6SWT0_9ACTN|nr:MerR family transcriptional regulator [Aeromicrobium senzhongii]MTB89069.1 MerR family DNA-binding transcriptional regulator [Aeromicrobium senzhongii]QNL93660.1 MerR family transcriptional regulator [Aeromicrobium senzhongii]